MDPSKVKKQVGKMWVNADGQDIPIAYISTLQKIEEKKVSAIFTIMTNAKEYLRNKKLEVKKHVDELTEVYFKENHLDQEQSSFTFYKFNRTVMLEVENSQPMEYDVNLIDQASTHFKTYLDLNTEKIEPAFKGLIEDMILSVQKDRLNVGNVKKLEKAGRGIEHPEIKKALELIDKAQGKGLSRVYYRVRLLNEDTGKYELIDVNFSSIII